MANAEHQPLLDGNNTSHITPDHNTTDLESGQHGKESTYAALRRRTKTFLTSKAGHYSVLALVSLDVASIFVEFLLQLLVCQGRVSEGDGGTASDALGIVSLVFSCLFVVELAASIWSFGWRGYLLSSWFHSFDAAVIMAGFLIDVLLRGIGAEIGSIVIVLRLWRVFKIIEELSAGTEERMAPLRERLEEVEKENLALHGEVNLLRQRR